VTKFYSLQHSLYGCLNPKCRLIYTQREIKSSSLEYYLKTHTYSNNVVPFEISSEKWDIDGIINSQGIEGWTPGYMLAENGFKYEVDIDIFELFEDKKLFNGGWKHDLKEKKDEIEKILDRINYKSKELVIFRSYRHGINNWDVIMAYSIGDYHKKKKIYRKDIDFNYKLEEKFRSEQTARWRKNAGKKDEQINWNKAIKSFKEYTRNTRANYVIYDIVAKNGYDLESVDGRKKLYEHFTKKSLKKKSGALPYY